jgi:hypothetical protein
MPNFTWFFLLFIISLFLAAAAVKKDRNMLIPLWLFNAGLAYLFEIFIFVFLQSYTYKPEVFASPFFDSTLGSLISQVMIVPMSAVVIAFYKFDVPVMLLVSFCISAIEILFLHLEIYEHHWWKTYFTTFFLPVAFYISSVWYRLLKKGSFLAKMVSLYLINVAISLSLTWAATVPLSMYHFQPGWFSDAARDHIAGNSLFFSFASLIYSFTTISKKKLFKAFLFGGLLIVQLFLLQKDFVVSFHGYFSFAALHLFIAGVSSLVWISFLQKKNRKK